MAKHISQAKRRCTLIEVSGIAGAHESPKGKARRRQSRFVAEPATVTPAPPSAKRAKSANATPSHGPSRLPEVFLIEWDGHRHQHSYGKLADGQPTGRIGETLCLTLRDASRFISTTGRSPDSPTNT